MFPLFLWTSLYFCVFFPPSFCLALWSQFFMRRILIFFMNFRRLKVALDVLGTHLSAACSAVGLSTNSRTILEKFLERGMSQYDSFCVEVLYAPASCRPDLFSTCVTSFVTVSSFAKTKTGTQCRWDLDFFHLQFVFFYHYVLTSLPKQRLGLSTGETWFFSTCSLSSFTTMSQLLCQSKNWDSVQVKPWFFSPPARLLLLPPCPNYHAKTETGTQYR